MRNTLLSALLLFIIILVTSCNHSNDKHKQSDHNPTHDESSDQTRAQPDTLQLDSLISDSVDYNRPESPRM